MKLQTQALLLSVLRNQADFTQFSEHDWDVLVRQGRATRLLARIGLEMRRNNQQSIPPERVWRHFQSEIQIATEIKRSIVWEAARIHDALKQIGVKVVLLKGAAYTVAGLQAGSGRLYQDTDILVPEDKLDGVDQMLQWFGWHDSDKDAYDLRYYREWMHELPPKYHGARRTMLDVHHNILPKTCALYPDAGLLLAAAAPIENTDYWMLAPEDMVLHSATHLFWNGEFDHGLRDLCDMDALMREFSENNPAFWQTLRVRAEQLGLQLPLFYALRYASQLLLTPVPNELLDSVNRELKTGWLDVLLSKALLPYHSTCYQPGTDFARWLLYVRSHWLRMPLKLLIPHLSRKAWSRLVAGKEK